MLIEDVQCDARLEHVLVLATLDIAMNVVTKHHRWDNLDLGCDDSTNGAKSKAHLAPLVSKEVFTESASFHNHSFRIVVSITVLLRP